MSGANQTEKLQSQSGTQPSSDRLQIEAMLSEGGGVTTPTADPPGGVPLSPAPPEEMSTSDANGSWVARRVQAQVRRVGHTYLVRLAQSSGRVSESLHELVWAGHRRADQLRLALELVDDFKDGTYRLASWSSVAALAGALLYHVRRSQPGAALPAHPFGTLDQQALLSIAMRIARSDLVGYCRHKGYRVSDFFAD